MSEKFEFIGACLFACLFVFAICVCLPFIISDLMKWNFFYFYAIWYFVGLQCSLFWTVQVRTNPKYCGYIPDFINGNEKAACCEGCNLSNSEKNEIWLMAFFGPFALPLTFPLG
jgi:hypothetical protein